MPTDPRLDNIALLTLAAYRLQQRRQVVPRPDWRYSEGLSSLLEAAQALPERDPWDLPSAPNGGSMGRLLEEARQWRRKGGEDGA
jgi:hypothetical protein